jgi:uncharacterized protein YndB with AHSA1/START domain/DNA-binding transcriptional ArsR family regulator
MVNDAFRAVAHPIRREIVERLAHGPATVGEATVGFEVSKPAITKHLRVLEAEGVITREVAGRTHRLKLNPAALNDAVDWIDRQRALWEHMFDTVEDYLAEKENQAMANTTDTRTAVVRIERAYRASAEDVFDAWTNPEVIKRWWHPGPDWVTATAEVDLRVGGQLVVVMRDANGNDYTGRGQYTVVDRPSRLAWIWHGEEDEAGTGSQLDLAFVEHDGHTTVTLIHDGLPDGQPAAEFHEGWDLILDNLARELDR